MLSKADVVKWRLIKRLTIAFKNLYITQDITFLCHCMSFFLNYNSHKALLHWAIFPVHCCLKFQKLTSGAATNDLADKMVDSPRRKIVYKKTLKVTRSIDIGYMFSG